MSIYDALTILSWLIFIGYWILAAGSIKSDKGEKDVWQSSHFAQRVAILFLVIILSLIGRRSIMTLFSLHELLPDEPILEAFGTVLVALGIAVAVWARIHLGRNWSARPAIKIGHVLVTSGPYRYVRHPIYAGILLAILGSVLVGGVIWLAVLLFGLLTFPWRITREERLMTEEFPAKYPVYKVRTKALIPFIL